MRHHDRGAQPASVGRKRDAPTVINPRGCDNAGGRGSSAKQIVNVDQPAQHLECTDWRAVLVLHLDLDAATRGECRPANFWRWPHR
jgi:hypothetical protein